jgi:hypothetical protein
MLRKGKESVCKGMKCKEEEEEEKEAVHFYANSIKISE